MGEEDLPRFQVGEHCYTGYDAAGHAIAGKFVSSVGLRNFGAGPEQAVLTAYYEDGSYIDGQLFMNYLWTGLDSGSEQLQQLPMWPARCQMDNETSLKIADMSEVWALFFGALILIACWKGIQNLFNTGPHD